MSDGALQVVVGTPSEVSVESSQDPLEEDQLFEGLIQLVTQMKALRPDIVRGIPVYQVLHHLPRKWVVGRQRTAHGLTVVTERLDEFWSHSWRTRAWLKYVNILVLNNGYPAFVVGNLCALGAFSLGVVGILPIYGVWSTASGAIGYYVTLFLWRSRKLAFLDLACINQTDKDLKGAGLLSMGAFLRSSRSLLVLWDETYVTRFWCIFEMAGFLHCKGSCADSTIQVCPVFTAPALCVAQFGLSMLLLAVLWAKLPLFPWTGTFIAIMAFPCLLLLAYVTLAHCRSIDVMQKQVRHFTVQESSCYCCDCGHVGPRGEALLCDRLLLLRCISAWFGTTSSFESLVRTRILTILVHQLANQVFSYGRVVQAASPAAWAILDLLGSDDMISVLEKVLQAVTYLFCLVPSLTLILLRLAYRVRNLGRRKWTQWLLSVALVAVGAMLFVAFYSFEHALFFLAGEHSSRFLTASIAVLTVSGTVTLVLWRYLPAIEMPQDPTWAGISEPTPPTTGRSPALEMLHDPTWEGGSESPSTAAPTPVPLRTSL